MFKLISGLVSMIISCPVFQLIVNSSPQHRVDFINYLKLCCCGFMLFMLQLSFIYLLFYLFISQDTMTQNPVFYVSLCMLPINCIDWL